MIVRFLGRMPKVAGKKTSDDSYRHYLEHEILGSVIIYVPIRITNISKPEMKGLISSLEFSYYYFILHISIVNCKSF